MTGATTLAVSGIPNSVFVEARLNQGRTEPIQQLPISMFRATAAMSALPGNSPHRLAFLTSWSR